MRSPIQLSGTSLAIALVLAACVASACAARRASGVPSKGGVVAMRIRPSKDDASMPAVSSAFLPPAAREISIAEPASVACHLQATRFTGDLQLRPSGPVFAHVVDSRATLLVPVGVGSAHLTIESTMTVRGFVDSPAYFMAKATVLGGFVVPRASTRVVLVGLRAGLVLASLDVSSVFVDPAVVSQRLPCGALALAHGNYDARVVVTPPAGATSAMRSSSALSVRPGGPPVARLKPMPAAEIVVGAAEAHGRRVAFANERFVAFGWVPEEALDLDGATGITPESEPIVLPPGREIDHAERCPHAIAVLAEVGGERAIVGTLRAGARFYAVSPRPPNVDPAFEPIVIPGSWLDVAVGAVLLVRKRELSCHAD